MMLRPALKRFARCEQGVGAIEFALVAPFLLILLLGGFEVSRFLRIQQKAEKIAFTVADVVAQADPYEGIKMQQVLAAVDQIMKPFPFKDDGVVLVTRAYKDEDDAKPKVTWQCRNDGLLGSTSKIGLEGQDAVLPNGFVLEDKDYVIITEVFYEFTPILQTRYAVLSGPSTLYKTALFRPRLGALTSKPC